MQGNWLSGTCMTCSDLHTHLGGHGHKVHTRCGRVLSYRTSIVIIRKRLARIRSCVLNVAPVAYTDGHAALPKSTKRHARAIVRAHEKTDTLSLSLSLSEMPAHVRAAKK